uniref:Uncharacterized protein n=2 Tax=viral metagenome TaxID=1070528 RepID=A0A6M3KY00_9ZZZZ
MAGADGEDCMTFPEWLEATIMVLEPQGFDRPASNNWIREYYDVLQDLTAAQVNYGLHQIILAWRSTATPGARAIRDMALSMPRCAGARWARPVPVLTPLQREHQARRWKLFLWLSQRQPEKLQEMFSWSDEQIDQWFDVEVARILEKKAAGWRGT